VNAPNVPRVPPQRVLELGAYVVGLAFDAAGAKLAVATGAGRVHILGADPRDTTNPLIVDAHRGAALGFARGPDGASFVSGGDDGVALSIAADGARTELLALKGKWIDAVATHQAKRLTALISGRDIHLVKGSETLKLGPHPSSVTGISFSPDGSRLAASHYGGVTIWLTDRAGEKRALNWKGSHVTVAYAPNAKFLATSTQDNALHVWRLANAADMQMQGYPAKVKSLAWTKDGNWLLSSGADLVVCWGFAGKGPEGKPPLELTPQSAAATVSIVAAHPAAAYVAAGFSHGALEIADIAAKKMLPLAAPSDSPVSALAWADDGWRIAMGTESGRVLIVDLRPAR
jgi:WD40 repeat protein